MVAWTKFRMAGMALGTAFMLVLSGWWLTLPAQAQTEYEVLCSLNTRAALAEAIEAANASPGQDVISIRSAQGNNCLIPLSSALPTITDDLILRGASPYVAIIRAPNAPQLRLLNSTANLTVENMTLQYGNVSTLDGGGIRAAQALTLRHVSLTNNLGARGGAVFAAGPLVLEHVTIHDNVAAGSTLPHGGGIYAASSLTAVAITVTENTAEGHSGTSAGGGIYVEGSAVISDAIFVRNRAPKGDGGGLYSASDLQLTAGQFYSNTAIRSGGGLYVVTQLSLADSRFERNNAERGGGVHVGPGAPSDVPPTIMRSHFVQNRAREGGGIFGDQTILVQTSFFTDNVGIEGGGLNAVGATVEASRFVGNNDDGNPNYLNNANGGGAYIEIGTVRDSYFENNHSQWGSGLYLDQGTVDRSTFINNYPESTDTNGIGGGVFLVRGVVQNSYFERNRAHGGLSLSIAGGGGLAVQVSATVKNNRFVNNTAVVGGGIFLIHLPPATAASAVINNLFIDNNADDGAAMAVGIGMEQFANGTASVYHNTITRREKGDGSAASVAGGTATFRNNIVANYAQGIAAGSNASATSDANLFYQNTLNLNGLTAGAQDLTAAPLFRDPQNGDYRLQPESPGIDSGLDVGITEDFDGAARPQGEGFDRGAYEHAPINQAPVAAPDNYTTPFETALVRSAPGLLANDTDPDGDSLTALLVDAPTAGNLTLNQNGSFTYVPPAGFSGSVNFTYRASDGQLTSDPVAVTITVQQAQEPVIPPPSVVDDSYTTQQDTPLVVPAPGVLGNDNAESAGAMNALLENGPQQGTLTLNANGSFTYTPTAGFSGEDQFTYRARAGDQTSSVATVTLIVEAKDPDGTEPTDPDPTDPDPTDPDPTNILVFIPRVAR